MDKKSKILTIAIICTTVVILAAIGAFVFVNLSNQNRLSVQSEQGRKDKLFSECMERTKTETVGMRGETWINKDGDENYCRSQMEK